MRHTAIPLCAFALLAGTCIALPVDRGALTVAFAACALGFVVYRRALIHRWPACALLLAVCCSSYVHAQQAYARLGRLHEERTRSYVARVLQSETRDDRHVLLLELSDGLRAECDLDREIAAGTSVTVRGRLTPYDSPRNPGEPDQRLLARARGSDARLESCAVLLERSDGRLDANVLRSRWRSEARAWFEAQLGEPATTILAGELWGERGALPPLLQNEFQETGTVHVLVTAGLHVGLIAAVCTAFLRILRLHRVAAAIAGATCVAGFVWFSGAHLPAMRAGVMATFVLAAYACGRRAISWNALAAAAIVILLYDPLQAMDASFWLSFCCVASIFSTASTIEPALHCLDLPDRAREALVLTIATQLGTWPLTASIFLRFAPYALLANLAIVPVVPIMMCAGLLDAALAPAQIQALAILPAHAELWCVDWMLGVLDVLDRLPWASIPVAAPPTYAIALYELALVMALPLSRSGGNRLALWAIALATSCCIAAPSWPDGMLKILVLDVGQADAIAIITPAHHAILVDAGGRLERGAQGRVDAENVGERIVVPALLRQGVTHVDLLILSHPHGDHAGGCAPLLRAIRVAKLADSGQTYGGHAYHDCLDTAAADHVPVVQPRAGMVWRSDEGVTLTFIGPSLPFIGGKNAINDNSVAFILQYRSFRMLFTGDAGVAAERRFLDKSIDLRADVLKVGHHGSAYSSSPEFIAAVHPSYAIISVGRHNVFGHPAVSTVAVLEDIGATVYRTDEDGATTVTSDGLHVSLSSGVTRPDER